MTSNIRLALLSAFALVALPMAMAGGAAAADPDDKPVVVMDTSMGPITLELDRAKAPITVDNFLKYVDAKFYDGTVFHRVIEKLENGQPFMIQGGGFTPDYREKEGTRAPIKNESTNGLKNLKGTIAMARTQDPDSATAQFFINLGNTDFLDGVAGRRAGYAVFGKVIQGMDVVEKIAKVPTATKEVPTAPGGQMENVPKTPVVIKSIRRKAKS